MKNRALNYQKSLGLKNVLKMPGLEPRTSRLSRLSVCAYHLRYIPVYQSAHALYIGARTLRASPAYNNKFLDGDETYKIGPQATYSYNNLSL